VNFGGHAGFGGSLCVRLDFNRARGISEMKSFKLLLVIVAGTTTAALLYFGTGLHPIWPLLWFAPIPVIAIAPQLRASHAFALATVAWFFGATNLWKHLAHGIGLPWALVAVSFLISAIVLLSAFCSCAAFFDAARSFSLRSRFHFTG
jgi:apolipoprotein N-acyltransferase